MHQARLAHPSSHHSAPPTQKHNQPLRLPPTANQALYNSPTLTTAHPLFPKQAPTNTLHNQSYPAQSNVRNAAAQTSNSNRRASIGPRCTVTNLQKTPSQHKENLPAHTQHPRKSASEITWP